MMVFVNQQEGEMSLRGDIGFAHVASLLKECKCLLAQYRNGQQVQINFAQAKHLDGSIIALMISLLRHAKSLGIKVNYTHVPDHVLRISELYGVRSILPIVVS